ncbi:MAG TPA: site-2 protease family protein [Acetobacteraceae bacterium]|nr:site-2 protease family protein [Acetobacteraceae bacterium]
MGWSFPIGVVRGTVIRIHLTFLLLLAWIAVTHGLRGGTDAAVEGVVFISLVFLCVLLHEFGHVTAARRYGIQTPDITLLPIGGVARMERIPEEPGREIAVALAGPAVNVVIALLLALVLGGVPAPEVMAEVEKPGVGLLQRLFWVNVFLVVFNMIPAFPMDGGRVLRAILAYRMGHARGTEIAARIGQALAFGLGLLGLFGNPLLIFIAFFVYLGAASEAAEAQLRAAAHGLITADAMETRYESLSPMATVGDAVEALIRTPQTDFPVVDGAGRLRGVLTRDDMVRALRETGPETPVVEAMRRDIPAVNVRVPLQAALAALRSVPGAPAVAVEDVAGRLVGLLTHQNLAEFMMVNALRSGRGPGTAASVGNALRG